MTGTIHATRVLRAGHWQGAPDDRLTLDYEGRFVRRKRLLAASGRAVMVDLPETVSLSAGDALEGADGTRVVIEAAAEAVLRITGDLPRLAWHIGNRHTPCQVGADHLVIRDDHVMARMLAGLGAGIEAMEAPFTPEGGAYGHGRTHGHSHGHSHGPEGSDDPHVNSEDHAANH